MIPARFSYLNTAPCPQWLKNAMAELNKGVAEVPGKGSNPRILEYRKFAHTPLAGEDSIVPWCAIGANAVLEMAGLRGTRSAMARSFLVSNHFDALKQPVLGCFVVLSSSRGPTSGHIGFYVGESDTHVFLLGGNQDDAWGIDSFPKTKVLGYRYPKLGARPPSPWNKPIKVSVSGLSQAAVRDA